MTRHATYTEAREDAYLAEQDATGFAITSSLCVVLHADVDTHHERAFMPEFQPAYYPVAIVETDNPEEAWSKTNHAEAPWWSDKDVLQVPAGPSRCHLAHRSSAVGDVIILIRPEQYPTCHLVMRMGCQEGWPESVLLRAHLWMEMITALACRWDCLAKRLAERAGL